MEEEKTGENFHSPAVDAVTSLSKSKRSLPDPPSSFSKRTRPCIPQKLPKTKVSRSLMQTFQSEEAREIRSDGFSNKENISHHQQEEEVQKVSIEVEFHKNATKRNDFSPTRTGQKHQPPIVVLSSDSDTTELKRRKGGSLSSTISDVGSNTGYVNKVVDRTITNEDWETDEEASMFIEKLVSGSNVDETPFLKAVKNNVKTVPDTTVDDTIEEVQASACIKGLVLGSKSDIHNLEGGSSFNEKPFKLVKSNAETVDAAADYKIEEVKDNLYMKDLKLGSNDEASICIQNLVYGSNVDETQFKTVKSNAEAIADASVDNKIEAVEASACIKDLIVESNTGSSTFIQNLLGGSSVDESSFKAVNSNSEAVADATVENEIEKLKDSVYIKDLVGSKDEASTFIQSLVCGSNVGETRMAVKNNEESMADAIVDHKIHEEKDTVCTKDAAVRSKDEASIFIQNLVCGSSAIEQGVKNIVDTMAVAIMDNTIEESEASVCMQGSMGGSNNVAYGVEQRLSDIGTNDKKDTNNIARMSVHNLVGELNDVKIQCKDSVEGEGSRIINAEKMKPNSHEILPCLKKEIIAETDDKEIELARRCVKKIDIGLNDETQKCMVPVTGVEECKDICSASSHSQYEPKSIGVNEKQDHFANCSSSDDAGFDNSAQNLYERNNTELAHSVQSLSTSSTKADDSTKFNPIESRLSESLIAVESDELVKQVANCDEHSAAKNTPTETFSSSDIEMEDNDVDSENGFNSYICMFDGKNNDANSDIDYENMNDDDLFGEQLERMKPLNSYYSIDSNHRYPTSTVLNCSEILQMDQIKKKIRQQLLGISRYTCELIGLEHYVDSIVEIFSRTIAHKENQSLFLIGSCGSGKKSIIRRAVEKLHLLLDENTDEDLDGESAAFMEIYLDGCTLQNEVEAFKEIIKQLLVGGETTLNGVSFYNMYDYLKQTLHEKMLSGTGVLFVLDDIDAFLTGSHSRQMLLYNLLDWMQSKTVQIGVIGISRNFSVLQHLEKRVKSRFSNRQIILNKPTLQTILEIQESKLSLEEFPACEVDCTIKRYNKEIKSLYSENQDFRKFMERLHDMGKPIGYFLQLCALAVSQMQDKIRDNVESQVGKLSFDHFKTAYSHLLDSDPRFRMLPDLSIRELVLLVSMMHLEFIGETKYTFEMVFNEYLKFSRSNPSALFRYSRSTALLCFENLLNLHLVKPVGDPFRLGTTRSKTSNSIQPEYRAVRMLIDPEKLQNSFRSKAIACSFAVQEWALKKVQK